MFKKIFKDYAIMALGGIVIGLGISFVITGNLGGDAMTTFQQGISRFLKIELPIAQIIANAIFVVLLFVTFRDRLSVDTVLCPLFIAAGSKIGLTFMPSDGLSSIALRVVFMMIGFIIVGLGIGIGAQTQSGSNPYDGFILAFSERINKQFGFVRPFYDAVLLIIGILLGGTWGVGTVIATLTQGYIGNFFIALLKRFNEDRQL